jgi:hypothetical protein
MSLVLTGGEGREGWPVSRNIQPRITALHKRNSRLFLFLSKEFVDELTKRNRDFANPAGDDEAFFEVDFEAKSHINTAKLQETAAERTAGQPGWSEFREKTATADEDFTGPAADDVDFVGAVFSPDSQGFQILHRLELNAFIPIVRRPSIE